MAMTRRSLAGWTNLAISAVLALGIWVLATLVATQPALKTLWDLSPQARFSVEPATEQLLADIRAQDKKVEFHTIFVPLNPSAATTPELRHQMQLQERLHELTRDLLRQYDYLGGDAVEVTHHDLRRSYKEIKEVMRAVQNRRFNSVIVKMGNRSKSLSISGDLAEIDVPMARNPVPGSRQGLPTLKSYKGEEAISTALKRLLTEGSPVVYFLRGYSRTSLTEGIAQSFSEMVGALSDDGFEVKSLDLETARGVPDDAAVVVLVDPHRDLLPGHAEFLYQYLRRGGRIFLNLAYVDQPVDWNPRLSSLGEKLGFELGQELICHAIPDPRFRNQSVTGTPMVQNLVVRRMNPTHPVTKPLLQSGRHAQFKAGREIRATGSALEGVRIDTSFLRTDDQAWLEPRPVDWIGPSPTPGVYRSRSIGAVVDVDPEEGERTGHLVLISAAGFDNLGFSLNGDLALNLFNWLSERRALISIRGSRYVARDLTLSPQQTDRVFWLLVLGVPGSLLLLGIISFWRRSRV